MVYYSGTITVMKQVGAADDKGVIGFVPQGVIFDVDDTLLNNYPSAHELGLHERARLEALHEVGRRRGIPKLATVEAEINRDVVKRAKEHTVSGGVWQLFYEIGLVDTDVIDQADALLNEIVARKHELYIPVMREFGTPLPQAVEFVQAMYVLTDGRIAIASGAQRECITYFLEMTGLGNYFLPNRIIAPPDIQRAKPDPEAFNLAFTALDLPDSARAQTVAFEDDPKGITSAKQAGLFVAAITSRYDHAALRTHQPEPDIIASHYVDFAEIFGVTL